MTERRQPTAEGLRYPNRLVERYGAKAGVLLYIAERLPDIPQAKMVVNEPGESTEALLARANAAGIRWPRLFRSSAIAELTGYEGRFPTEEIEPFEKGHEQVRWNDQNYSIYRNREYFDNGVRKLVERIKNSPGELKAYDEGLDLPDEINVIIAEKAKSKYVGTYIKHPNQERVFLLTITEQEEGLWGQYDPKRTSFKHSRDRGLEELRDYSLKHLGGEAVNSGLAEVVSWHDRIASLPDMDSHWAYQVEFGIDPPCLFQVRPFKPIKQPTFTVKPTKYVVEELFTPIVIGTTSSRGVVLRVVDHDSDTTDEDVAYVDDMRGVSRAENFPNLKAVLVEGVHGFLQHNDVRAMRIAEVTGMYKIYPFNVRRGDQVRVKSDGERIKVTKVKRKTIEDKQKILDSQDLIERLKLVYAENPVLLGKLENYAKEYAIEQSPDVTIWETDGELRVAEVEIEGKHDNHITTWTREEWNCDCDMFHGRGKFEGMQGECSHTMTLRILAAKEGYEILLPSEQEH